MGWSVAGTVAGIVNPLVAPYNFFCDKRAFSFCEHNVRTTV